MATRSWNDLSSAQRTGIIVGGALEIALTTMTWRDLAHRPAPQVRGPKLLWVAASVVQPFGPIAYWVLGRRRA